MITKSIRYLSQSGCLLYRSDQAACRRVDTDSRLIRVLLAEKGDRFLPGIHPSMVIALQGAARR